MSGTTPLYFFGASAFPEIGEIVRDINAVSPQFEICGIFDDADRWRGTTVEGVPVLGALEEAKRISAGQFVLGIGSYRTRIARYRILERLGLPAERFPTLIHPSAKIYSSASIGQGCILFPGVVVFAGTTLENFVEIAANTVIGAHNHLCEGALITSLVTTTSGVVIGHYSHIGTGSAVGENVRIGAGAQISMGSLVLKDIPPGVFSFGNPPRLLDKVEMPQELLDRWNTLSTNLSVPIDTLKQ